jgi:hypothetical protein
MWRTLEADRRLVASHEEACANHLAIADGKKFLAHAGCATELCGSQAKADNPPVTNPMVSSVHSWALGHLPDREFK